MQILQKTWTYLKINIIALILLATTPFISHAQDTATHSSVMFSDGKILVVFLVLSTIFTGIIIFLIYIERKIKRLEKDSTKKNQ